MLIDVTCIGSVPYSGSNNNFTKVSLSDFLISFIIEKYIVDDICELRSPHLSPVVCSISHLLIALIN